MRNTFLCAALVILSCGFALGQAQYKVLWSFGGAPSDGFEPVANLVLDAAGDLYGTTEYGGTGQNISGTVFELSPQSDGTWSETIIYNFCSVIGENGCSDGASPEAGLTFDAKGNLYGTTAGGGANYCPHGGSGCGTVFELSTSSAPGGTWTETVLYSFCATYRPPPYVCLDGDTPLSVPIFDASGNLYATTSNGGDTPDGYAYGTVFELSPGSSGWTHTVLYNFCSVGGMNDCEDGATPAAGVTFDKSGNLYGTTEYNGKIYRGGGTVYELSPGPDGWTETLLFAMQGKSKDSAPVGTVVFDPLGKLYTTFSEGGSNGGGGVLRLSPHGQLSSISFDFEAGLGPTSGPLLDLGRKVLYGTINGSPYANGSVFQLSQSGVETTLYNFCSQTNCTDGEFPNAGLIEDKAGNLYGTTKYGGEYGFGVVFEITP